MRQNEKEYYEALVPRYGHMARFRGIEINTYAWIYGYYFARNGHHYIQKYVEPGTYGYDEDYVVREVYGSSVCQSTGRTDPYGKDIYENDIVIPAGHSDIFVVKYCKEYGAFCLMSKDNINCDIDIKQTYMLEPGKHFYIVGNIIDNMDDIDDNTEEDKKE